MPGTIDAKVKWGKEEITLSFAPEQGVKALKTELEEKTGVPVDRMKIMPKSKGREKNQNHQAYVLNISHSAVLSYHRSMERIAKG